MKKDKKELYFWKRHFNIKNNNLDSIPTEVNRFNFRHSEVDDEWLLYITSRIKVIHQLDLDETLITDKGIYFLTKLETIKELRLKGCRDISKECLNDLNQIKSLELLHLGGTSIDLDDLYKLSALQSLKLILVSSSDNIAVIKEKVSALKHFFPLCIINVNHQIWDSN